jgi:signal transduction histidine kinase
LRREIDEAVNSGASVADFVRAVKSVDREAFRDVVVPHLRRAPGAIFLAWAPRVRARQRQRFEAAGRRDWGRAFGIFDTGDGRRRAEGRVDYFPVYYRETLDGEDDACFVGWDLGVDPASREAIDRARDTGQPAMTAMVKLDSDANAVLVYWPIYEKAAPRSTVAERRKHLRGVIAVIFEIDRLMGYALGPTPQEQIDVSLVDDTEAGMRRQLYARYRSHRFAEVRAPGGEGWMERLTPKAEATMTLDVGGRRWGVTFTPAAGYHGARSGVAVWLHLALGLLATTLVGGYLLLLIRRTDRVEQLVAFRTHALRNARDRLVSEVAERARAEEVARRLSQEALSVQEEMRRRLSRELHDEAGQSLTGLALHLRLLESDVPDEHPTLRQRLREAEVLASATAERMRALARDLRPPGLDTLGLNASLRGLCHTTSRRTGVPVGYSGTDAASVPDTVAVCLYRVLQEALTNAVKHARAAAITVVLQEDVESVTLSVADDGQGFDAEGVVSAGARTGGIGLVGMQERLENLGGWMRITSRQGEGTCLIAQVPVVRSDSCPGPISPAGATA